MVAHLLQALVALAFPERSQYFMVIMLSINLERICNVRWYDICLSCSYSVRIQLQLDLSPTSEE